jgi:hypothetical protein
MRILGVRVGVILFGVVVVAVGIVVLYFLYGRGPQPGDVLLHDDFSEPSSTWPAGAADGGFTSFTDGAYLVGVDPDNSLSALADVASDVRDVRVEASVVRMPSAGDVLVGLACRGDSSNRFYELLLSRSGEWAIRRGPGETVLARGGFNPSTLGSGSVRLQADCTGGIPTDTAQGPSLRLALSVNGTVVGVAHEKGGGSPLSGSGVGFVVVNGDSDPADVRFDDFDVKVAARPAS